MNLQLDEASKDETSTGGAVVQLYLCCDVNSLRMLRLHRGQVCCSSSQGSTQSLWYS